jgi:hypothetical protein
VTGGCRVVLLCGPNWLVARLGRCLSCTAAAFAHTACFAGGPFGPRHANGRKRWVVATTREGGRHRVSLDCRRSGRRIGRLAASGQHNQRDEGPGCRDAPSPPWVGLRQYVTMLERSDPRMMKHRHEASKDDAEFVALAMSKKNPGKLAAGAADYSSTNRYCVFACRRSEPQRGCFGWYGVCCEVSTNATTGSAPRVVPARTTSHRRPNATKPTTMGTSGGNPLEAQPLWRSR